MTDQTARRVTLVTSNGWGLGHLSREVAIALAIGDRGDVTMFSFSGGLPLVGQFGIRSEYCPSHTSPFIERGRWNEYVERRFQLFLDEVDPHVVLFDGVAPYPGIIDALLDFPAISAGWLRRGMWVRNSGADQLAKTSAFDFVIEPGDLASPADTGPTARLDAVRVPPVSLLEVVPRLSREEAALALGLDPDKPSVMFALGSGQPGDASDASRAAFHRLTTHDRWQPAVVNSPLGERHHDDTVGGVQVRGVFPLLRYFEAFDVAVSAAGYNSVHELIPSAIPSLLVPKSASRTDDQIARAKFLADQGMALMASDHDLAEIGEKVDDLLGAVGRKVKTDLETRDTGSMTGGAGAVARYLLETPPSGGRLTGKDQWRQPGVKGAVKRAIGPSGVAMVQRMLGRAPTTPARNTVTVAADATGVPRLLLGEDMSYVSRASTQPVENLLAGASPSYVAERRGLVEEFYDVIG